jgi:hypothetical protein
MFNSTTAIATVEITSANAYCYINGLNDTTKVGYLVFDVTATFEPNTTRPEAIVANRVDFSPHKPEDDTAYDCFVIVTAEDVTLADNGKFSIVLELPNGVFTMTGVSEHFPLNLVEYYKFLGHDQPNSGDISEPEELLPSPDHEYWNKEDVPVINHCANLDAD